MSKICSARLFEMILKEVRWTVWHELEQAQVFPLHFHANIYLYQDSKLHGQCSLECLHSNHLAKIQPTFPIGGCRGAKLHILHTSNTAELQIQLKQLNLQYSVAENKSVFYANTWIEWTQMCADDLFHKISFKPTWNMFCRIVYKL